VATFTPSPATIGTLLGKLLQIKVANTNTSTTPTININGFGAVTIVNTDLTALLPGQLFAGGVSQLVYDGTYFQLQSSAQEHRGFSNIVQLTGSGNWTVPAGVFAAKITAIGAGGGGGGAGTTTSSTIAAGAGGNSGSWAIAIEAVTPGQVIAYSCGSGGSGGSNSGGSGSTGGTTTILGLSAPGGTGGNGFPATTPPFAVSPLSNSGVGSGGTLNFKSQLGGYSFGQALLNVTSGAGAGGYFNGGGNFLAGSGAGNAGTLYGAGGGGALALASTSGAAGGAGSNGTIIIEY
jgi:hypothetical protein